MSQIATLHIAPQSSGLPLTPAQKRFNTLVRQIEQARAKVAAWRENIPLYRESHAATVAPLEEELKAAWRGWVFALAGLLEGRAWTKTERAKLLDIVQQCASKLLELDPDDREARALFDRYSEIDYDAHRREMALGMKSFTEWMADVDLGDDEGIASEEDVFERVRQAREEAAAEDEASAAKRATRAARRPKTAAQQRREREAQQATQTLREIYRKLASSLHPDRETDEGERAAKTQLMQRVNQAYAANDLLGLLELQLQIEQIDASHAARAGAERLKHYNKVLAEQLEELRAEIEGLERSWQAEFGTAFRPAPDPRRLAGELAHAQRMTRASLLEFQAEMRMFADAAAAKRWLKRQR